MNKAEQQLKEILDRMDVPLHRKYDYGWLLRNLGVRNSEHPDFNEAITLLKRISKNNTGLSPTVIASLAAVI